MKVYLGYSCYYNGCDVWKVVEKVFDCEEKALCWKEDFAVTETEWREYEEMDVE